MKLSDINTAYLKNIRRRIKHGFVIDTREAQFLVAIIDNYDDAIRHASSVMPEAKKPVIAAFINGETDTPDRGSLRDLAFNLGLAP